MNNLVKVFRGFKTLLNRVQGAKKPATKKKYEEELQKKLDAALEKTRRQFINTGKEGKEEREGNSEKIERSIKKTNGFGV